MAASLVFRASGLSAAGVSCDPSSCLTNVLPQEFFHLPHRPLEILISFSAVVEEPMPSLWVFDEAGLSADSGETLLEVMDQLGRNQ